MLAEDLIILGGTRRPGFNPAELAQGSSTVVPADITTISCILQARGGTGANNQGATGGGGGGGGAWGRIHSIPVTPGDTISVTNETISSTVYTTVRINGTAVIGVENGNTPNNATGGSGGNQYYKAGVASALSWFDTEDGDAGTDGQNVSYHSGGQGGNAGGYPGSFLGGTGGIGAEDVGSPATAGNNHGGGGGGGGAGGGGQAGGTGRLYYQYNGTDFGGTQ